MESVVGCIGLYQFKYQNGSYHHIVLFSKGIHSYVPQLERFFAFQPKYLLKEKLS